MSNISKKKLSLPTVQQPAARWAFVLVLCAALGIVASYYWRVFYGLDARGLAPLAVTGFCVGLSILAGTAALLLRRVKDFAKRGTACILLCGALFVFANPPMQTPDETDHYLRTYAISMGHFDFDAERGYPEDVNELVAAFPGAWVNAHTSAGVGTDPDTHAEQAYNTAGYALKQYGKDGRVESIWDSFTQYLNWESRDSAADSVTEPISFLILPFLPGALGMALARLLGFGALGCLYGGRLVNLLAYAAMCYAALRTAHKCKPAFLCIMLLPMSLYMGASLSYDATLLGCYYVMLALFVGSLLTAVMLKVPVTQPEFAGCRAVERYFGRFATFFLMAMAQALVTAFGCLYFVGMETAEPALFVLACCLCSLNFASMNYALVYALDNVGMALSVVIMVIQVAGSGGSYPVHVLPQLFQTLYPFMPFHYGMDMIRETVGGMYGDTYLRCALVLLVSILASAAVVTS